MSTSSGRIYSTVTVVAATRLEAAAVRRAAPAMHVVESGIALSAIAPDKLGEEVVTCGLAGGLREDLPTGSMIIPEMVATTSGDAFACDTQLSEALIAAAKLLGHLPHRGSLLTSPSLISGAARTSWAQRGYTAVDMETGFVRAKRIAAVRVILDTPKRELSEAWLRPIKVLARPDLWPQALWLMREAPRCARLAAEVLALAFKM